jgi:hypothetical protein
MSLDLGGHVSEAIIHLGGFFMSGNQIPTDQADEQGNDRQKQGVEFELMEEFHEF